METYERMYPVGCDYFKYKKVIVNKKGGVNLFIYFLYECDSPKHVPKGIYVLYKVVISAITVE